jgi:hypothetical protein
MDDDNDSTMSTPMVSMRTPFDENTPQKRAIKYSVVGITVIFIVMVTTWSIVNGFQRDLHFVFALEGIGLFFFALTTFALMWRIHREELEDVAKIPVYSQIVGLLFMASAILFGVNDVKCKKDSTPYYENLSCWESSNQCLLYANFNSGDEEKRYKCINAQTINATLGTMSCPFNSRDVSAVDDWDQAYDFGLASKAAKQQKTFAKSSQSLANVAPQETVDSMSGFKAEQAAREGASGSDFIDELTGEEAGSKRMDRQTEEDLRTLVHRRFSPSKMRKFQKSVAELLRDE